MNFSVGSNLNKWLIFIPSDNALRLIMKYSDKTGLFELTNTTITQLPSQITEMKIIHESEEGKAAQVVISPTYTSLSGALMYKIAGNPNVSNIAKLHISIDFNRMVELGNNTMAYYGKTAR